MERESETTKWEYDFDLPPTLGTPEMFSNFSQGLLSYVVRLQALEVDDEVITSIQKLATSGWNPIHVASHARNFSARVLTFLRKSYPMLDTTGDPLLGLKRLYYSRLEEIPQWEKDWGQKLLLYLSSIRSLANVGQHPESHARLAGADMLSIYVAACQSVAIFSEIATFQKQRKVNEPAKSHCTFVAGKTFLQKWYHCVTCGLIEEKGICLTCVRSCHNGHDITVGKTSYFSCCCGFGKGNSPCKGRSAGGETLSPENVFHRYEVDFGEVEEKDLRKLFCSYLLKEICKEEPALIEVSIFDGLNIIAAKPLPVHRLPWVLMIDYDDKEYKIALVSMTAFVNPTLAKAFNQQEAGLYDPEQSSEPRKKQIHFQ